MITSVQVPKAGKKYFYKASLPSNIKSPSNPRVRSALERMTQPLRTGAQCKIVFFKKSKAANAPLKAVQRCDDRKLSTGAKRRWTRLKGKAICRCKASKCGKYGKAQFMPCKRGKRR